MPSILTFRTLSAWVVCCVAAAFAVGYLTPIAMGPFVRPEPILTFIPGVLIAAGGVALIFRHERMLLRRLAVAAFVLVTAPPASCEGVRVLYHSRLQPLSYGVRRFEREVWVRMPDNDQLDRARSQMVAQLTLGGLLQDKQRIEIRRMLGDPDCSQKVAEDAWQLGFVTSQMDPDCLHVGYDRNGRSVRAQVLQQ